MRSPDRSHPRPTTRAFLFCLLGVVWSFSPTASQAGPCSDDLLACVRGALNYYNDHSGEDLFPLTQDQLGELRDGEVVLIRRRVPAAGHDSDERLQRLTAYILVPQPMKRLWLASLSPDSRSSKRVTEHCLSVDCVGNSRWYQHLALPWPVSDRHWVIDVELNTELCREARGAIWERTWSLTEQGDRLAEVAVDRGEVPGFDSETVENAIYVPVNRGSWIMFRLEDEWTLIAYRVSASLGGSIPESIVSSLSARLVGGLLRGVAETAPLMEQRYVEGRRPEYSGAGERIPYFSRSDRTR